LYCPLSLFGTLETQARFTEFAIDCCAKNQETYGVCNKSEAETNQFRVFPLYINPQRHDLVREPNVALLERCKLQLALLI
jgi:hypothetical protein